MTIDEICEHVESLGGVLTIRPAPGDGSPEVAWGDVFFYFAPDRVVPSGQPFATVVTKDYPGEPSSALGPGEFRVNIDAGRRGQPETEDPAKRDQVMAHLVYGQLGWVCVVQPGSEVGAKVPTLLSMAHDAARRRWERRHTD